MLSDSTGNSTEFLSDPVRSWNGSFEFHGTVLIYKCHVHWLTPKHIRCASQREIRFLWEHFSTISSVTSCIIKNSENQCDKRKNKSVLPKPQRKQHSRNENNTAATKTGRLHDQTKMTMIWLTGSPRSHLLQHQREVRNNFAIWLHYIKY